MKVIMFVLVLLALTATCWMIVRDTDRNYWYMNYYQNCNQPEIKAGKVKVFGTILELKEAIGEMKFRCPSCGKESSNPYECKACGWKVYGLLGDMGKGVFVYVKERDYVHAGILGAGQSIIARRKTSVVKYIIVCAQKKSIEKHIVVDVEMFSQNRR